MSKKNVFINNGQVIDVAKGKMQWNTATEQFRKDMQYRYDAAVKCADTVAQAQDDIKTIKGMIDFTMKQPYYSSTDIDNYNAQIQAVKDGIAKIKEEFAKNAPEISDADKNLYYAYKAYVLDEEDTLNGNTYQRAFYEWAIANGVRPTADTFTFINKKIGMKKLGAKAIVKANGEKFTGALSATAFYGLFYGVIMECLKAQNLLKGYEFNYKFPEKTSKAKTVKVNA